MNKVLSSVLVIGLVSGAGFLLTQAFFSDTETSSGNTMTAGAVDLQIANESYYNGNPNANTSWELRPALTNEKFFDFSDIKPGDWGEDTITLRVENNPVWACAEIAITQDDDGTCTDPELVDDPSCVQDNENLFDGEIAQNVSYVIWNDDGDNVLEDNESPSAILAQGKLDQLEAGIKLALVDSQVNNLGGNPGDAMLGETNYFLGKAWCFGDMTLVPVAQGSENSPENNPGFTCDEAGINNASQTDVLQADITFNVVQTRNNPNFVCEKSPILIDTFAVAASSTTGANSNVTLELGKNYLVKASGTWSNRNGVDSVDAEYNSYDNWVTPLDGDPGWTSFGLTAYYNLLELQLDDAFVIWGAFSPTHEYEYAMPGTGSTLSARIFDGLTDTNTITPSWYNDNSGSLTVKIYLVP